MKPARNDDVNLPTALPNELMVPTLDLRISTVRKCFEDACGSIDEAADMTQTLRDAERAVAIGFDPGSGKRLQPEMGRAAGTIWRLANTFTILAEHKVNFNKHLQVMKLGSTRFGEKDAPGKHKFKDFELELHVAGLIAGRSQSAMELHDPGKPFDITFEHQVCLDCKHPSSEKNVADAISECGKALAGTGARGVLVVGMEDMLELGEIPLVNSAEEIRGFAQRRSAPVFRRQAQTWTRRLDAFKSMLGIFFMASVPVFLKEGTTASFMLYPLTMAIFKPPTGVEASDRVVRNLLVALR